MEHGLLAFPGQLAAGEFRELLRHHLQRFPRTRARHLKHTGAFQIVEVVKGGRDRRPAHDDAVVGEDRHVGLSQFRPDSDRHDE